MIANSNCLRWRWERENVVSVTLNERVIECIAGTVAQLRSGELLATAMNMWKVYVWRIGEQNARPLNNSGNAFDATLLSVFENVLGREELLALTFNNRGWMGLFAIEHDKLVLVQLVELGFHPFAMLWIASKQTLLVSNSFQNEKQIFALRVSARTAFANNVTLEGRVNIRVHSWCLLRDHSGNEKNVVLVDVKSISLMKFELG